MKRIWSLFFLMALSDRGLSAAELFLKALPTKPSTVASIAIVTLTPIDPTGGESRKVSVTVGEPSSVPLPEGSWHVHTSAAGYFSVDSILRIRGADEPVTLQLWRTATLRGKLSVEKEAIFPSALAVRWNAADPGAGGETPPDGSSPCIVQKDVFSCNVPLGALNLRLRAPAYITHFRWNVKVDAGGIDVGTLALRHGASIVGRVALLSRGAKSSATTRVFIRQVTYDGTQKREALLTTTARPDNGFFEFNGVAAGEYLIGAMQEKLRSREMSVSVKGTSESEMNEPLVLEPPLTLRVVIDPKMDPEGRSWKISLSAFRTERSLDSPRQAFAEEDGVSTWNDLLPARYLLSIGSHLRGTALSKEIDLHDNSPDVFVTIPSTSVRGTVRLGGRPISGVLTIGGHSAPVSIPLDVAEDGGFSGTVPFDPKSEWIVAFDSTSPPVRATRNIRPRETAEGEGWQLDVSLDGWGIDGNVVDADGNPVAKAIIDIYSTDGQQPIMQVRPAADGSFSITGLAAGGYDLAAKSFRHESSDAVTVHVGSDDDATRVKLVVTPDDEIKGQVISPMAPIAGARVFAFPTDKTWIVAVPSLSAPDGSFRVPLAPGTREIDLVVSPPGFPLKMVHLHVRRDPLTVTVEQNAGSLELDVPELRDTLDMPQGVLVHRGAVQSVMSFLGSREAVMSHGTVTGTTHVSVPMMEPGDYALCAVPLRSASALHAILPPQDCVFGTLAPFGSLHLATRLGQ
ncbi:MAG TPA: carboxypeptidase-like regulatory domain-containing protein [Thermoanaerobaculia bacterium]